VTTDIFLPTVTWVGAVSLSIGVRSHTGVARTVRSLRSVTGGNRGTTGSTPNTQSVKEYPAELKDSDVVFLLAALLGP